MEAQMKIEEKDKEMKEIKEKVRFVVFYHFYYLLIYCCKLFIIIILCAFVLYFLSNNSLCIFVFPASFKWFDINALLKPKPYQIVLIFAEIDVKLFIINWKSSLSTTIIERIGICDNQEATITVLLSIRENCMSVLEYNPNVVNFVPVQVIYIERSRSVLQIFNF